MIDPVTLSEVWDAHAERLMLIARSIGDPAEDAVQEAFLTLAQQRQLPDDPLAWLVRVVRNQLLQWHRSGRRRRTREVVVSAESWFRGDSGGGLDAREATELLMSLSSPEREVIVMHLWGEMTFDSIAEIIGISRASAHRAFQRGLETLKTKYDDDKRVGSMRLCNE